MKRTSLKNGVSIIALPLLLLSCSSSKITSSWNIASEAPVRKILLVGLVNNSEERTLHSAMEDHVTQDLRNAGYKVEILPEKYDRLSFEERRNAIQTEAKKDTIDAVLTIALVQKQQDAALVRDAIASNLSRHDAEYFWDYSYDKTQKSNQPNYYVATTSYYWEVALFNLADKRLAYIATTRSFDFSSKDELAHEFGKVIVKDMKRKHVLK